MQLMWDVPTCTCCASSPWGHAFEELLLGWVWAREQELLALVLVENRKQAGWCLLSMPNLEQVALLFMLLLSLPLIFMFL